RPHAKSALTRAGRGPRLGPSRRKSYCPGELRPMDFLDLLTLLRDTHVNYRGPEQEALESQLRDATSPLMVRLVQEFGRVVVLDASLGEAHGDSPFNIDLFLRAAWKKMATSLGHFFDDSAFHPEQIAQLLKSEEPLLFCFLKVGLLSHRDLERLRG